MAVTCTRRQLPEVPGAGRWTVTDVQFDSSYPNTGGTIGEPLTAADLGLSTVLFAIATLKVAGTGSVTAVYYDKDAAGGPVLKAYAAAAQIANTTDISAVTAQVFAYGT